MVFRRKTKAQNTVEVRPTLRALAISDARPEWGPRTLPEVVAQKAVDVVITVGDLHRADIAGAERLSVPVIGVFGNHCDGRYLDDLGATNLNLHLSQAEVGRVTFTGVQGCVPVPGWQQGFALQPE